MGYKPVRFVPFLCIQHRIRLSFWFENRRFFFEICPLPLEETVALW